jgi:ubiquinone/menaquinone biosynthesis C-methylase UbiE
MGTKCFFDKFSGQYEAQSRYQHHFYKWIVETIIKQIDKEQCKILDLGTGNGELSIRIALRFPESQVTGLDISAGMINEAKMKAKKTGIRNIRFVVSPMEKLNARKADFAVSSVAFHHIKNKELVISKIYQILPKGGKLIIGDWFKPSKEYRNQIEKIRNKNLERAKEFDKSWNNFLKGVGKVYKEKHPKEYPVSPAGLKDIMKVVGFRKQRIIKCPLPNFAVVVGVK